MQVVSRKGLVGTLAIVVLLSLPAPALTADKRARIGQSITLRGQGREVIRVTAVRVIDPLEVIEGEEIIQPPVGRRFVGVWVRLRNVGPTRYRDSPSNGSQLVTAGGRALRSRPVFGGVCDGPFASNTYIPKGQVREGCISFEVPTASRLRYFEFTLASGFADETGQWRIGP